MKNRKNLNHRKKTSVNSVYSAAKNQPQNTRKEISVSSVSGVYAEQRRSMVKKSVPRLWMGCAEYFLWL